MEFIIKTTKREEMIDITSKVKGIVDRASEADSRACLVYSPHTTCAIIINENSDEAVKEDILEYLRKNVKKEGWKHSEGNADSHIKSVLFGESKIIPLQNGLMQLGKWQGIFLAEFDGPRERVVLVRIL